MATVAGARTLEFRILGRLEVVDGERVLALGGAKQRAVLVLLLLRSGEVVSSERLIDELWAERPPATAASSLQVYISRLRKELPGGTLVTEGRGYRLAVGDEQIDARRFGRLVEEGAAARGAGDDDRAAHLLRDALALWRGPALVDFEYEPFAQAEIARLEELRLAAIEERVEADLACGRAAGLVGELEALVAQHPLRERLRGQLMLALYRSGRQAEALQAYQDARRTLVDELGIEPSPALRELEAAVLAQDAALASPKPVAAAAPAAARDRHARAPAAAPPPARKLVTILFSDVVASSRLAADLDPEWLDRVMGRFLDMAAEIVARHGGTVEKFIGDAVMAAFGVPRAHEDDPVRGLRAALEIRAALPALNEELRRDWGVHLAVRTGVNTGEVMTGDPAQGRLVTGDAVVIASRLQTGARPGEILAGERTAAAARGALEFDEPLAVEAKGRDEPLPAHPVLRALSWERPRGPAHAPRVFVGRAAELDLLATTHARVLDTERPHLVAVLGEPGVGKTTLLAAFRERLGADVAWHAGRCVPYGEAAAYGPVADIVRSVLGEDDAVAPERLGDRRALALALGQDVGLGLSPEEVRPLLREAWVGFLAELAGERPAVIAIEDVHWAGDALLELVEAPAREPSGPLLVAVTARPEFAERALAGGAGNASQLRLDALGEDEAAAMLERLGAPAEVRERVLERAGGNPFFIEEALAAVVEQGAADFHLPDSVHALIAARIDLLPLAEREALLAAAVVGRTFWEGAARALLDDAEFDGVLLEERGFVLRRRHPSLPGERELAFAHALTQEVAYGLLPRARRALLHGRAGEWLEEAGAEPALLAHHYAMACELAVEARLPRETRVHLAQRSLRFRPAAARRALRSGDADGARRLLARDLDLRQLDDPDLECVAETGRLLVALGDFAAALEVLGPFADREHPAVLRELGVATCKIHRDDPGSEEFRRGQDYLDRAAATGDVDATASLAGTWKGIDEEKVRALYRRASRLDPSHPYPLGSLLEFEIAAAGDLSPVETMREQIAAALERCRREAAGGENLPWAHYDLGKLGLLSGDPYAALMTYAKAIDLSPATFMLETSLASLERLSGVAIEGLEWTRDLLRLALRPKPEGDAEPVVIVAGGTESDAEAQHVRDALLAAFEGFTGTIVAGGTVQGVSGLAGEIGARHGIRTIGYLPRDLPAGADLDPRYSELRQIDGGEFGPREPLAYWDDLLRAGHPPEQVRLLGLGGGRVAAAEYAIALALGATLGIAPGSGRAADELLDDPHWSSSRRLLPLAADAAAFRAFVAGPSCK